MCIRHSETPGRIIRQLAETPDGARYPLHCDRTGSMKRGFNVPQRRYAIALGCEVAYAQDFVYADGLDIAVRLCLRSDRCFMPHL